MIHMTNIPTKTDEKAAFSHRLNQLCDAAKIPPKGKNRQSIMGKLFGVSQKGARKWLEGESLPQPEKIIKIATYFGASIEWLWTGRGPRYFAAQHQPEVYQLASEIAEKLQKDGWRPPSPPQ